MEPASNLFFHPLDRLSTYIVHNFSYDYHDLIRYLLVLVLGFIAVFLVLNILFKLIRFLRTLRELAVFIEITPPLSTEISSVSTTELFNLISGLLNQSTWLDKLLLRQHSCTFEIVSQKETGIRYLVRASKNITDSIEKNLRSYVPGIIIKEAADYLPSDFKNDKKAKVIGFKLARHFSLPLNEQSDLQKHDPLAYLTGNMTQLKEKDLLAFQIVIRPINGFDQWLVRRELGRIRMLIHHNRYVHNTSAQRASQTFTSLLESVIHIALIPLLFVSEFASGIKPAPLEKAGAQKPSTLDSEIAEHIKSKLSRPIFETTVRALLLTDKEQMPVRQKGLLSSFSSFLHPLGQSITAKWDLPFAFIKQYRRWQFKKRLGGAPIFLTTSEVAALYHFPFVTNSEQSDLVRIKSRELPAPLSLKQTDSKYDVVFGVNKFGNDIVPIGLTMEQRQKHMYIIGKTGMGKTTLLKNAIYQDMLSGKGMAVLDPHGDLLQELLQIIPENRKKDVIVFDPSDRECPIGLNILAPGIHFKDIDEEQDKIASSVISVFKKIAKDYWGPRMEHILKNATLTALQTDNPSLYTLQRLLTEKDYQKKIAATLKDPVLRQFWNKEFALLGKMQLGNVTAPLTQRLGSFITTKMSRHILLQEKSTISVSQIMDEGKILLVNLSKGDLGEDMSFFFGTVITSLVWMGAYRRTEIPEKDRKDFFLYVDEFQNFATPSLSEITSEGRKYHVSLIACHQNLAQVEDKDILKVVAGNANTIICLKASPDDENFILPFMEPEVEKGDIVNLAPFRFFMKLTNEQSENAFSGQTVPLDIEPSDKIKADIINYSRKHNATPRREVEEYLDKLLSGRLEERISTKKTASKRAVTKELLRVQEKTDAGEAFKSSKRPQIERLEV